MEFVELTLIDGSKEYVECEDFNEDLRDGKLVFDMITISCTSGNIVPYHAIVKWRISKDKPFETISSHVTREQAIEIMSKRNNNKF